MSDEDQTSPEADKQAVPNTQEDSPSRRRRVTPKSNRPLLPAEIEDQFVPVDEASARSYEAMEDAGTQVEAFTKAIEDGVVRVELEATESLVFVIRPPSVPRK